MSIFTSTSLDLSVTSLVWHLYLVCFECFKHSVSWFASSARMGAEHARARHWPRGVTEAAGCAGAPPSPRRPAPRRLVRQGCPAPAPPPPRTGIPTVTTTCPFMSLDMVDGHNGHMVSCTRRDYVFSMEFSNRCELLTRCGNLWIRENYFPLLYNFMCDGRKRLRFIVPDAF